jgi:amino acid adenylation domain-containing protein
VAETPEAFPRRALEGSLGARFEAMARAHPDRLAVRDGASALTYAELDALANRLGRRVLAERGEGSEPLVILARQDVGAIVAMLAAAKIGKIFAPLDPRLPASRLAAIVRDSEAPLLLAGAEDLDLAREIAGPAAAVLDRDAVDPSGPATAPGVAVGPGTPLSLFYTSGSTGVPKGVLGSHRLIVHRAWAYAMTAPVTPGDRLSVLHALSGGGSLRNLWGGLLSGGAVLPYDVARDGLVGLGAWLDREAITICHCAASVFRHFGAALTAADGLAALRLLWVGNEPVLPSDVQLYRDRFPDHCDLVVGLATTEAATVCEYRMSKATRLEEGAVPIGWPIADKEVLILGEDGRPLPPGETGEMAVRSDYLALGYWRRPALDRAVFAPDPEGGPRRICRTGDLARVRADGAVFHLGRKDDVPKVRGRFVDLLEVERVLTAHAGVAVAAAVVREDQPGEGRLVAYVVPAAGATPTVSTLRAAAEVALPDHMVPTRVVFLTELPRTANGKVDRKALPAPARARPRLGVPYQAPATPLEVRIARVWADALDLDAVGAHDPFLDLGGQSLLASRIITRVRDELAVEVPLAALLTAPTVAAMARLVTEALLTDLGGRAAEQALADVEGLPPRDGAA